MSVLEPSTSYKPFKYPWAVNMAIDHEKITPSGMRTTNTSGGISIGEAEGFASYVSNLKPSKPAVAKETASRVGAGMLGLQALQQEEEQ